MSSKNWRKNTSVVQKVTAEPFNFSFFQIVRLLERASIFSNRETLLEQSAISSHSDAKASKHSVNPVSGFIPPASENIYFYSHNALTFANSSVEKIQLKEKINGLLQWQMQVNFIGLNGTNSTLPYHYTELILQRLKAKDPSLLDFLDLFNHRITSLFYRAGTKYHLPLEYERQHLFATKQRTSDPATATLLSLIGLSTEHMTQQLSIPGEALIYYSGLLTQKVRTPTGLKAIIQHQFGIDVCIEEFVGQWQDLIDDVRSRMPSKHQPKGQNIRLGKSVIVGARGWFAQGKIRIILGPLDKHQRLQFAPGTKSLKALSELIKFYAGLEINYDIVLRFRRADIPRRTALKYRQPPALNWNAWLAFHPLSQSDNNETVDVTISTKRLT
ncbi:MAG: type VI secretion system baseplate subunit TssG [Pseudomonadota bacterium]